MKPASSTITDYVAAESRLAYEIHEFVRQGIDLESMAVEARQDDFWKGLSEQGTELWLDSEVT